MNYYCLIAGLPDIQQEDQKHSLSIPEFRKELEDQLSASDYELIQWIFADVDNKNLLKLMENKEAVIDGSGNLTVDDWHHLIALIKDVDEPKDAKLQNYIVEFFRFVHSDQNSEEEISLENRLAGMYFNAALKIKNEFLSNWFEFNLNIQNILTAYTCRKYQFDVKNHLVGNNEVAKILKHSNSRDFGLTGVFDQAETLIRIAEEQDLLEREKKIDALKWNWLEENTFFHYFTVEKIAAYCLKLNILDRWKLLSVEEGATIFRALLEEMKKDVVFTD